MDIGWIAALVFAFPAVTQDRGDGGSAKVTTPSGDAELILLDRTPNEALAQLQHVCAQLKWRVLPQSNDRNVLCDLPSTEKSSTLRYTSSNAMDTNQYTQLPVQKIVRFELKPHPRGIHVIARAERRVPHISDFGRYVADPMDGAAVKNGLMNIIALAGSTAFVPGTTFADVGYLGIRSDRYVNVQIEGQDRVAIEVGGVDEASPADLAEVEIGDLVLMMNGRSFKGYEDVSRFLRSLRPGSDVTLKLRRRATGFEELVRTVATDVPDTSIM